MNLERILDLHIAAVRKIVSVLPPCGDLKPMCGAWGSDGKLIIVTGVELTVDQAQRRNQHDEMVRWLKIQRAAAYTWAAPGWRALIPSDNMAARQASIVAGGGVQNLANREEVIICIVGDKSQTISADLDVERDRTGRITQLRRGETSRDASTGLFYDLLLEPKTVN